MKYWYLLVVVCTGCSLAYGQPGTVNPIIGDTSFLLTHGQFPDLHTEEQMRVRTHLAYAENRLREAPTDHLSADQLAKRTHVLDLLRDYHQAGKFPINTAHPVERRPCFIDDFGTICAVGYLVEQTDGRKVAREINKEYQYAYLNDMTAKLPLISSWAKENGLTTEECAMIQPSYSFMVVRKHRLGITIGPTYTFGKITDQFGGGALDPQMGIELGLNYYRRIYGMWGVTTGLLFNRRKVEASVDNIGFRLQNDRLIVPLYLTWDKSYFYNKRLDRLRLVAGLQASVYASDRPDGVSYRSMYGNFMEIDKRPELDASIGIAYTVEHPIYVRGTWMLRYNHGLINRQSGTLKRGSETAMTYQLPGNYITLTYTLNLIKGTIIKRI